MAVYCLARKSATETSQVNRTEITWKMGSAIDFVAQPDFDREFQIGQLDSLLGSSMAKLFLLAPSFSRVLFSHLDRSCISSTARQPHSQYPTLPLFLHRSRINSKPITAMSDRKVSPEMNLEFVRQGRGSTRNRRDDC